MKNRSLQTRRRLLIVLGVSTAAVIFEMLAILARYLFSIYDGSAVEGWWWNSATFSQIVVSHFGALGIIGAVIVAVIVTAAGSLLVYQVVRLIARGIEEIYRLARRKFLERLFAPIH